MTEAVAWQRRRKFALANDPAGKVYQWEACPRAEATGYFERVAGFEYRPLYTAEALAAKEKNHDKEM